MLSGRAAIEALGRPNTALQRRPVRAGAVRGVRSALGAKAAHLDCGVEGRNIEGPWAGRDPAHA